MVCQIGDDDDDDDVLLARKRKDLRNLCHFVHVPSFLPLFESLMLDARWLRCEIAEQNSAGAGDPGNGARHRPEGWGARGR